MSALSRIKAALDGFGYPVEPDVYTGDATDRWFTYNYADDRGTKFSDDEPEENLVSMQVHHFMPKTVSFTAFKEQVREALVAQGFEYPAVTAFIDPDSSKRHLIFEFDGIEDLGEED